MFSTALTKLETCASPISVPADAPIVRKLSISPWTEIRPAPSDAEHKPSAIPKRQGYPSRMKTL